MNLRRTRWQGKQLQKWCQKHYNICLAMKCLAILIMLSSVGIGTYSFFNKDVPTQAVVAKTTEKECQKVKKEPKAEDNKDKKLAKKKVQEITRVQEEQEKPKKLVEELIAEHTISSSMGNTSRNNNLAIVAETINKATGGNDGYLLNPGEKFSWLRVVGDPTEEKGYEIAGVVVNGKSSTGYGGGICQVSSTIFSAMAKTSQLMDGEHLFAQRHSKKSSYIDPEKGDKEATVTYSGNIDFWFVSTLPNPIRIYVETGDGTVTVKVFEIKEEEIPNEGVE